MSAPTPPNGAPSLGPADRISHLPEPDPDLRWDAVTTDKPDWWCTYHGDYGYHADQPRGCPACQTDPPYLQSL